jgi:hypothetical protein
MIVAQMIVDCLVRRNQFFRNAKFVTELSNNLLMLKGKKEMKQLPLPKHDIMNAFHYLGHIRFIPSLHHSWVQIDDAVLDN